MFWSEPLHEGTNSLAYNAKKKADLLAKLFASNLTLDDREQDLSTMPWCESRISNIQFYQRSVRLALLSLDFCKLSSFNRLPPIVLKS